MRLLKEALGNSNRSIRLEDYKVGKYFEELLKQYGLKGRYWYGC